MKIPKRAVFTSYSSLAFCLARGWRNRIIEPSAYITRKCIHYLDASDVVTTIDLEGGIIWKSLGNGYMRARRRIKAPNESA